jgi:hypothetical protein
MPVIAEEVTKVTGNGSEEHIEFGPTVLLGRG